MPLIAGRSVLVTGGAGFLGSCLTRRPLHLGADVHFIVRFGSDASRLAGLDHCITWI